MLAVQKELSDVFTSEFSFNEKLKEIKYQLRGNISYNYESDLDDYKKQLIVRLQEIYDNQDHKLHELYELNAERWRLKAKLELEYYCLSNRDRNRRFFPYQRFAACDLKNGIKRVSFNYSEDLTEKGYLFNSTNASSKRSHYFVLESDGSESPFEVKDHVINAYNLNLKKFRVTDRDKSGKIKAFYNIFNGYDELVEATVMNNRNEVDIKDGVLVFFCTEKKQADKLEISSIGRTPYFKIPYANQLRDLIKDKRKNQVDYANALFGFIPHEPNKQRKEGDYPVAYKSRIRFSPLDIHGKVQFQQVNNLILMSPSATASGMYLQQPFKKKLTYGDNNIKLNGYKYYHVLSEKVKVDSQESERAKLGNIQSSRTVITKNDEIRLSGKIYFSNLTEEELGLLLLSLDWKGVLDLIKYGHVTISFRDTADKAYELIGGAKSYGFGKVKVNIKHVRIDNNDTDFDTLMKNTSKISENWVTYIEKFIDAMNKTGEACDTPYFQRVHFDKYVHSKMEKNMDTGGAGTIQNPKHVNWNSISDEVSNKRENGKSGGYPVSWRLKTPLD